MIRKYLADLRGNPCSLYGKAMLEPVFVIGLLGVSALTAMLFPDDAQATVGASLLVGVLLAAILPCAQAVEPLTQGARWRPMPDTAFMRRNVQLVLAFTVPVLLLLGAQGDSVFAQVLSCCSVSAVGAMLAARLPIWRTSPKSPKP